MNTDDLQYKDIFLTILEEIQPANLGKINHHIKSLGLDELGLLDEFRCRALVTGLDVIAINDNWEFYIVE